MNKKLIVMLFPAIDFTKVSEEYLQEEIDKDIRISDIFDTIIQERYLDQGYDFAIATYPDRPVYGISIKPSKTITSKSTYDDFYKRDLASVLTDYTMMAKELNPNQYSEIVVGGYHLGDCVDKFATAIENNSSAKVVIDSELTNMFTNFGLISQDGFLNQNYQFYSKIKRKIDERKTKQMLNDTNKTISIEEQKQQLKKAKEEYIKQIEHPELYQHDTSNDGSYKDKITFPLNESSGIHRR